MDITTNYMKLNQIRAFCEVAELGTLARASERLFLAPTAISTQITQLEEHLGGPLFDRTTKPMTLTALGRFFLPRARELLNYEQHLEQDTRDMATGRRGWLTIGFTRSLIYSVLPMTVRAFRSEQPEVNVELVEMLTETHVSQLRKERIQIGLSRLTDPREPPPGLKHTILFEDPLIIAMPMHKSDSKRRTVEPADLKRMPLISFPKDSESTYPKYVRSALRAAGVMLETEHEANEIHTALGLVAAGLGYAVVGASVAQRGPTDVRFMRLRSLKHQTQVVALTLDSEQNLLSNSMVRLLKKFAKESNAT